MSTSTTTPLAEERTHLHQLWAAVAPSWGRAGDFVDARHGEVTARLLAAARPGPGDRLLELACGAGGVGLAAAPLVGPAGEVVLSDVVAEMTEAAGRRIVDRHIANATTRLLDVEAIDEPDGSYDVVVCRDGMQFALHPAVAVHEVRRVLRPGGRAAFAVWAERERNPWLGIVFEAASAQLGRPVPPPGMPSPFSLGERGLLAGLLDGEGLADIEASELDVPMRAPSFDAWWTTTTSLAGPLAALLASLPGEQAAELRERARRLAQPFLSDGGLDLPGVALIVSGRAP